MRFQERLIRKSLQGIHCIPGKPSQLFYSLHTAALNPVISPKEHFFRHNHRNPPAPISGNRPRPKAPSKAHCSHPNSAHPVLVLPQTSVFLGGRLSRCGATSVHTGGRDSAAAEEKEAGWSTGEGRTIHRTTG